MKPDPIAAPSTAGDTLDQHQRVGARWLAGMGPPGAMLLDEPGVGKTAQAIRACDLIRAQSVLVVCPAAAKGVWLYEFDLWGLDPDRRLAVHSYNEITGNKALFRKLRAETWDVLICDEAHFLKTPTSKRTRAIYGQHCHNKSGLAAQAVRTWLLTGTPAPNWPHEVYTHLRALWPDHISLFGRPMRHDEFVDAFSLTRQTPYGTRVVGVRNIPKLRDTLRPLMLRRKKAEVNPDLPPLRFVLTPLEIDPAQVDAAFTETLDPEQLSAFREASRKGDQALADWMEMNFVHLPQLRQRLGLLKVPAAAQLMADKLDTNPTKLLAFATHRDILTQLEQRLTQYGVVKIDGRTAAKDRHALARRFQTDPETRVFLGNTTAAGTAITLTEGREVFFVEPSWVPVENVQAAARAHRRGQRHPVLARYLTAPKSLDERIIRALRAKTKGIEALCE